VRPYEHTQRKREEYAPHNLEGLSKHHKDFFDNSDGHVIENTIDWFVKQKIVPSRKKRLLVLLKRKFNFGMSKRKACFTKHEFKLVGGGGH
jgi:hypothetical protein